MYVAFVFGRSDNNQDARDAVDTRINLRPLREAGRRGGGSTRRLKIGIIGFGKFGQFIASSFVKNHDVVAMGRGDYTAAAMDMGQCLCTDSSYSYSCCAVLGLVRVAFAFSRLRVCFIYSAYNTRATTTVELLPFCCRDVISVWLVFSPFFGGDVVFQQVFVLFVFFNK